MWGYDKTNMNGEWGNIIQFYRGLVGGGRVLHRFDGFFASRRAYRKTLER